MTINYAKPCFGTILLLMIFYAVYGLQQNFKQCIIGEGIVFESLTEHVHSKVDCATKCLDAAHCLGFQVCQLFSGCLNLDFLNKSSPSDVLDETAYLLNGGEANKLLARGKNVSISSLFDNDDRFAASSSVDGIYVPVGSEHNSLTSTRVEFQPWWRVDLDSIYCIWAVNILNRGSYNQRLAETAGEIFYTEGEKSNFCNYHDGSLNQHYTLITCRKAIRGQFVRILLNTTNNFNLYEVEVHGI